MAWDGDSYQRRFDDLASQGQDVHGEADFVMALAPSTVLDAGCGTGRVAIELARRGVSVVGADQDASMLDTARRRGPTVTWVEADLSHLALDRTFDVVVMAGNVPLFTPPGTEAALVAGCARHVAPGGVQIAGFQLGRGYVLDAYDRHCAAAGLELVERWATWDRQPAPGDGSYAVSVHRAPDLDRSTGSRTARIALNCSRLVRNVGEQDRRSVAASRHQASAEADARIAAGVRPPARTENWRSRPLVQPTSYRATLPIPGARRLPVVVRPDIPGPLRDPSSGDAIDA